MLRPLNRLATERGVTVEHAGCDTNGVLDFDELERLVTPGTRAVVVTHASNVTGNAVDIARVAAIAHAAGALVIVDASQSAGTARIDMQAMGFDVCALPATRGSWVRRGPAGWPWRRALTWLRGLWAARVCTFDALQPLEWPTRLEPGTLNGHGIAGLSAGPRLSRPQGEVEALQLASAPLPSVPRRRSRNPRHCALRCADQPARSAVSLNVGGIDSAEILGCAHAGVGDYDAPAPIAPAHAPCAGDRAPGVDVLVWIFNTTEEVDTAIDALLRLAC